MSYQPSAFWRQLEILRQRRRMILLATLVCGLVAGVASWVQPKVFRATTYLLVSESKMSESDSPQAGYVFYELLRSYETFLKNDHLILKTLDHFQLQRAPYELTPDKFRRRGMLQVDLSKNTRLLEVNVEFPNAQLAADIANYFAATAVSFNDEMNDRDTERARGFLKRQLDQAQAEMERASKALLEFSRTSRLEELRESVWNLLEQRSDYEKELAQFQTDLSKSSAVAVALRNRVNSGRFKGRLAESVPVGGTPDPDLSYSGSAPSNSSSEEEEGKSVSQKIQDRLAESEAERLSLQAAIQSMEKANATISARLASLLEEKSSKENTLERLKQEYQLTQDSYAAINRRYQDASISVNARSTDLKVVAPAIIPERPVKPNLILNVLLAMILGLITCLMMTILQHQWRVAARRMASAVESATDEKIKEIKRSAQGFS